MPGEVVQTATTALASMVPAVAERSPFDYHWITYLWVLSLSSFAGWVSWQRKVRKGIARPFNFAELLGELGASALAGLATFWLCEWGGVDKLLSAVLIAIAGHMGTRALFLLELFIEGRVQKLGVRIPKRREGDE